MGILLDTNIVTALMVGNSLATNRFSQAKLRGISVKISSITYYEIKRGLLARPSPNKLSAFQRFYKTVDILPVTYPEIVEIASEIYADLRSRGCLIQDADILIAATAIAQNWVLISNDSDLTRVQGLRLENWLIG
ncbi:MAG: type II toxin-antitoxin system VapC family toxin [Limnothrix sp. CACIAM 69d]|nr:MAG: type II toxin-antitoxin system VapC family toxin [Limnothrix sp. CACIAM 69d]